MLLLPVRGMSPEDGLQSNPLGYTAATEDFTLSRGDLDNSREPGGRARARSSLHTRTPESGISWWVPAVWCIWICTPQQQYFIDSKCFSTFSYLVMKTLLVKRVLSWKYWWMQKQPPILQQSSSCLLKMPWTMSILYVRSNFACINLAICKAKSCCPAFSKNLSVN